MSTIPKCSNAACTGSRLVARFLTSHYRHSSQGVRATEGKARQDRSDFMPAEVHTVADKSRQRQNPRAGHVPAATPLREVLIGVEFKERSKTMNPWDIPAAAHIGCRDYAF